MTVFIQCIKPKTIKVTSYVLAESLILIIQIAFDNETLSDNESLPTSMLCAQRIEQNRLYSKIQRHPYVASIIVDIQSCIARCDAIQRLDADEDS